MKKGVLNVNNNTTSSTYVHSNSMKTNTSAMDCMIRALERRKQESNNISLQRRVQVEKRAEETKKIEDLEMEITKLNLMLNQKDRELNEYKKRVTLLEKENQKLKQNKNYQQPDDDLAIALEKINEMERKNQLNRHSINHTNINIHDNELDVIGDDALYFSIPNEHPQAEIIDPLEEYERQVMNEVYPNPDQMTYEQLLELTENIGKVSRGLSEKELDKIPLVKYTTRTKTPEDCTICQDPFISNELVRKLSCGHLYHKRCVDAWLVNERTCPVCKKEVKVK